MNVMQNTFETFTDLEIASISHKFRIKRNGESDDEYRLALAKHVWNIDRIESHEIRTGKKWEEWNHDECLASYHQPMSVSK